MQLAHARRNHLFTRAETVGDRHSLRSHLADGDLTLLKISMRVIAFHHPDYRLVLWPVIGLNTASAGTMRVSRPALAGKLPRLTVTVPLTPPTAGKSSGRGMVNTICREGAIVAAAGMLFVFRGKLAARQGIDPDDGR